MAQKSWYENEREAVLRLLGIEDDPNFSLADLRGMTGYDADVEKVARPRPDELSDYIIADHINTSNSDSREAIEAIASNIADDAVSVVAGLHPTTIAALNEWADTASANDAVIATNLNDAESATREALNPILDNSARAAVIEANNYTDNRVDVIVVHGKNLYNPDARSDGTALDYTDGTTSSPSSAFTTGWIRVKGNTDYSFQNCRFWAWYDAAREYLDGTDNGGYGSTTETSPAGARYLRAQGRDDAPGPMQIEEGDTATSYEPYQVTLVPEMVPAPAAGSITPAQTSFVVTSKNLFNPATATADYYLNQTNGSLIFLAGYITSDYIPVKAGQAYTVNVARKLVLYNTAKMFVSGQDINPQVKTTFTPTVDGFARFSVNANLHAGPYQFEEGEEATDYEPFGYTMPDLILPDPILPDTGPLFVKKTGDTIVVDSYIGDIPVSQTIQENYLRNRLVNFRYTRYNGTTILNGGDDIAPIRTLMGTVGANHGFTCVRLIDNPGKTSADIGSVWSSGGREFVLFGIDSATGKLVIGGDYDFTSDGEVYSDNAVPSGPLSHVSGATNTGSIPLSGLSGYQLEPSVGDYSLAYWLDGKRLDSSEDWELDGSEFTVTESYTILRYDSIYDTAKANIGTHFSQLPIEGQVGVEITYRFLSSGRCLISTVLQELAPTSFTNCGFLQAGKSPLNGTRYIKGINPVSGNDFHNGVDLSSYSADLIATSSHLKDASVPPMFALDSFGASGGFAIGYYPFEEGVTSNEYRIAESPTNLWDMRGTGKIYPNAIAQENPGWGRFEAHGYRVVLAPSDVQKIAETDSAMTAWSKLKTLGGLDI